MVVQIVAITFEKIGVIKPKETLRAEVIPSVLSSRV